MLSLSLPKDLKQKDKIRLLSKSGFKPKEIADILGTTPLTVSVTLSKIRKEKGKREEIPHEAEEAG